jgi:hypothetical protein
MPDRVSPSESAASAVVLPEFMDVPTSATTGGRGAGASGSTRANGGIGAYAAALLRDIAPRASASSPSGCTMVGSSRPSRIAVTSPTTPPAATRWASSRLSGTSASNWSGAYRSPYATTISSPTNISARRLSGLSSRLWWPISTTSASTTSPGCGLVSGPAWRK